MESKVAKLTDELTNLTDEKAKLSAVLNATEVEVERLRRVEAEFADFRRSVMDNSPPCSSQIPKVIEMEVQKTPRSPFLSEKFNHMVSRIV